MSEFNERFKAVSIRRFLIFIILLYLLWSIVNAYVCPLSSSWVYLAAIFYFLFELRDSFPLLRSEISGIFSEISLKNIFLIVALNIFFSYGMLYLSDFLLGIPLFYQIITYSPFMSISGMGSFLALVLISPVFEELVFRGLFLNKLKLVVPTIFAVLISSVLFAALHGYGSMISAFVFAMCMAVIYIKTDNIFVPVFAHILNNFIAEAIVHIDSAGVLFTNNFVMGVVSVLAVISFAVIVHSLFRQLNNFK